MWSLCGKEQVPLGRASNAAMCPAMGESGFRYIIRLRDEFSEGRLKMWEIVPKREHKRQRAKWKDLDH